MTVEFLSLIFVWLLPLTTCRTVTFGHNHNFTHMMTEEMPKDQLLMQEAFTSSPPAEVSGYQQPIDTTLKEERTTTTPMNQPLQTTPPPTTATAATLTYSTSSQLNSLIVDPMSTTEVLRVTTPNMVPTSPASNSSTAAPRLGMSSTPSGDVTFKVNSFTYSTGYTNFASITTKSEASTSPVTMQATDRPNTSQKATKKRRVPIPKKKEFPPQNSSQKEANTGKIVAGIIGGVLVLMVVCFLVIYIKKWKLHKQQITTNDWAGPSPFINSGDDKSRVTLQSSNRISLSSFLPQRMSRKLSLLPEAGEELENINIGTTFGDHQEVSFNGEVAGADGHKSNGNAAAIAEKKNPADTPDVVENSVPTPTSETNEPL